MINLTVCRHCGGPATVEARSRVFNGIRITESCCMAKIEEDINCPRCGLVTQPVQHEEPASPLPSPAEALT